ncbi:hypothetical protein [Paenibacillus peoriae]|uniref:hypothetical protein n=1 Tax=Paenibacillus peoriae TaxID=59893 RepID=UPI00096C12DC|nr:hypothetical protein [Paenibacillus peoriae]OMF50863.1 hypothetical protein BK135_00960 [Paenibacillus peoriae]
MKLYTDGTIEGTPQEIAQYKGLYVHSITIKNAELRIESATSAEQVIREIGQRLEESMLGCKAVY